MRAASFYLVLAFLFSPAPVSAFSKLEATFVVLGPEGAIARAVISEAVHCPIIKVGDSDQQMKVRAMPDNGPQAAFPVIVCELLVPNTITSVTIDDKTLSLPKDRLNSVAALGDTGCRMKGLKANDMEHQSHDHGAGQFQDCDNPAKWPFARIAVNVANSRPDLVIHVGDYLYRESPCPRADRGCSGSPHGDNWTTWKADFFDPARPLLEAAPWIMTRGNHESCARAGTGYFRFLAPKMAASELPPACIDHMRNYTVSVADKSFIVMDTSNAADSCAKSCDTGPYGDDFADMKPTPGSWLLSHRPIWGIGQKFTLNATLQQALTTRDGRLPHGIELALSGHMHIWQLLAFADGRSPQLIAGNSGTLRDRINRQLRGLKIGGTTVSYAKLERGFGYTILRPIRTGGDWKATFFNEAGQANFTCLLRATTAKCSQQGSQHVKRARGKLRTQQR